MKKTPHQKFVDELRRSLSNDEKVKTSKCNCDESNSSPFICDESFIKELEKQYEMLFGSLDGN